MSTDSPGVDHRSVLEDYPVYNTEYYLDDTETPSLVTICSSESTDQLATEWISIEAIHAVPMEHIQ